MYYQSVNGPLRLAGFNGAATFPSRMSTLTLHVRLQRRTLQWGRDVSVADVRDSRPRRRPGRSASMGPRRFRRGCVRHASGPDGSWVYASMGPRRFRRGCCSPRRGACVSSGCFNGAATFPSRMCTRHCPSRLWLLLASMGPRRFRRGCCHDGVPQLDGSAPLQWGRDVSVADVRSGHRRHSRIGGASMGPRRFRRGCLGHRSVGEQHERQLQWGRDVSVADVGYAPQPGRAAHIGFNGAATFPSRMSASRRWQPSPRSSTSFNGAATFPSRMSRLACRRAHQADCFNGAATFPSRMSRGTRAPSRQPPHASMGPRRFRRGCGIRRRTLQDKAFLGVFRGPSAGPRAGWPWACESREKARNGGVERL